MDDGSTKDELLVGLRQVIANGRTGDRLPSTRELQRRYRVSPNTVRDALRHLAVSGLVEVRHGAGSFVAAPPAADLPPDTRWQEAALGDAVPLDAARTLDLWRTPASDVIRLTGGYTDEELIPRRDLDAALARGLKGAGVWGRCPTEGNPDLRRWFAAEIGGVHASEVLITAGGQGALSTAIRALCRPGDAIVVESPTYTGVISIARSYGLTLVPVPVDRDGLRTDLLAEAVRRSGARVAVVQPTFANPTGTTLSQSRRRELMELARRHSLFLIEDDCARYLVIDEPPPPPLAADDPDGHVVHIRSLTKPVAAGLRVAALCARGAAYARLRAAKTLDDFYVSGPIQQAAVEFTHSAAWPRHRRALARELGARRDALLAGLAEHAAALVALTVPHGGMHVWAALPRDADAHAIALSAYAAGVMVGDGNAWFPVESDRAYLRLTYGETPVPLIREGLRRLGTVLRPGS